MQLPRLTPRAYRKVTLVALGALAFIVVTGGAVRLTGSGLGCPDWPTCAHKRVVAPLQYHAMIEFGNRLVTGLVGIVLLLGTVVASSGPHGGDIRAKRLPFALHDVTRLHGIAVMLFLGMTVVTIVSLLRSPTAASAEVVGRAEVLLAAIV